MDELVVMTPEEAMRSVGWEPAGTDGPETGGVPEEKGVADDGE